MSTPETTCAEIEAPAAGAQSGAGAASGPRHWSHRITLDRSVSAVWAVVRGTAITVKEVCDLLAPPNLWATGRVLDHYRGRLTAEDLRCCLDCAADGQFGPFA